MKKRGREEGKKDECMEWEKKEKGVTVREEKELDRLYVWDFRNFPGGEKGKEEKRRKGRDIVGEGGKGG